ncbi:hypothetical protein CYMTET_26419 [Cymbomonas tetramitiformis]|uniref:Uncharacterized protein n=1 Tax=Cymbomonas tetramitiformis TaxID=36881 RepID=A0AAE0FSA8_9CHLO|nr:hypothetical protein CYMTET_26419 [Cymbomonas tetramitiformis]
MKVSQKDGEVGLSVGTVERVPLLLLETMGAEYLHEFLTVEPVGVPEAVAARADRGAEGLAYRPRATSTKLVLDVEVDVREELVLPQGSKVMQKNAHKWWPIS